MFNNSAFILKASAGRPTVLLLSGFTVVREAPERVRGREDGQREMAAGKQDWTGSRATLGTEPRWPWSSAVSALERIQSGGASQTRPACSHWLSVRETPLLPAHPRDIHRYLPVSSLWDYLTAPGVSFWILDRGNQPGSASAQWVGLCCFHRSHK